MTPDNAWRAHLSAVKSSAGTTSIQPVRSFWQRIAGFVFRRMPIESQR